MTPIHCPYCAQPIHSDISAAQSERDRLGELVREVWIAWALEQPKPKSSWPIRYDQLSEPDKEVDRRIGERLYAEGFKSAQHQFAIQGISGRPIL